MAHRAGYSVGERSAPNPATVSTPLEIVPGSIFSVTVWDAPPRGHPI
jgi:hypothetical protein